MNERTRERVEGLGFYNILTLMFVAAKLFGLIHWSWLMVFMPTILSFVLFIIGIFIIGIILRS